MLELLILVFTSATAANAVYAMAYGAESLDGLTADSRKATLCGAVLMLVTVITESIAWCAVTFIADIGHTLMIVVPLLAFGVTYGVAFIIKKLNLRMYRMIEGYIALIASNTAVVGIVYGVTGKGLGLSESVIHAACSAFGVMAAYTVFAVVREGIPESKQPHALRGVPTVLITAGLIAMVFYGFFEMRI